MIRTAFAALSLTTLAVTGVAWASDAHAEPAGVCEILRADPTATGKAAAIRSLGDEPGLMAAYLRGQALGNTVVATCPDVLSVIW